MPTCDTAPRVPDFKPIHVLTETFKEYNRWGRILGVNTVGRLNEIIAANEIRDFVKVAEGFGWRACNLDQAADPLAALRTALATPGPMFIHASIDRHEQVLPMVAPGAANTDMIGD